MEDFKENIENALDVLFKLDKQLSKNNSLLGREKIVYLQVVLFKIPFSAPRKRKFLKLCHSLYGDDPEICLFVPNRKTNVEYKKTTDELIDYCVDYYTELLEKHKVKGIKTVMPLKQLRAEYGTYDLKRKLARRFDLFLCKNSLLYNPRFLTSLGKIFRVANKEPLGVPFPKDDVDFDPEFQKNIDRAIHTSSFFITRFSDNYSIPFGCLSHSKTQLKENLQAVLKQILNKNFIPGGLKNIRAMNVWPSQLKPIPLFVNLEMPVNMKAPRVKSTKRKLKGVEDELSSQPYNKVFVMPSGDVFVTRIKKENLKNQSEIPESESDDSFKDDSDSEEEKEVKLQSSVAKGDAAGNEKSESEDDEEIEEKEAKLMELKMKAEEFNSKPEESEDGDEEDETENINFVRKQNKKSYKNFNNKSNGKVDLVKRKKAGNSKKRVNKTNKKTEMKQEKFKLKQKLEQKKKSKTKKLQKS